MPLCVCWFIHLNTFPHINVWVSRFLNAIKGSQVELATSFE